MGGIKYFRLQFEDETFKIVKGKTMLEVVKKYDLTTKDHINTRVIQLQGEQKALAIDYFNE